MVVQAGDARVDLHLGGQAVHEGAAGIVGLVEDAVGAVAAFTGEVVGAVLVAVKVHLGPVDEHAVHAIGALAAEEAHGAVVVVPVARHEDIVFQGTGLGITGGVRGLVDDAALGQGGIAVIQVGTGVDEQHVTPGIGQGKGGRVELILTPCFLR